MSHLPQDPRGPRLTRPHEFVESDRSRIGDDGVAVRPGAGGVAAAAGLVLGLLAFVILWLDWAYTHTGAEAAAFAAAIAGAGVVLALLGWRAARSRSLRSRGAMGAAAVAALAVALAVAALAGPV